MISKLVLACTFAALVRCEPPVPNNQYGTPLGAPLNSYGAPNYQANDQHSHEYGEPKAYEFGYQVKDDYSGNNYNRQEKSDGNQVQGEYRVALPDGRTQIVTYWADWQSGFHADVKYEGEAQFPDQYNKNQGGQGGYNYPNTPSNQYGAPSNNYNTPSNTYNTPSNTYNAPSNTYNAPSNQYSAPSNQYIPPSTGFVAPPPPSYDNNQYNGNNNYDSYNNGGFGNKVRPSNEYGAP